MQDLASVDKETLRRIAQKAEERVDALIETTRSVMAIHGTTEITPRVTKDAFDIYAGNKSFSEIVPSYSPGFCVQEPWKDLRHKRLVFSVYPKRGFHFADFGITGREKGLFVVFYSSYVGDELGKERSNVFIRLHEDDKYESESLNAIMKVRG